VCSIRHKQGRRADKANGPGKAGRQADLQGSLTGPVDVTTLTANIFAAATNRTNLI